MPRICSSGEMIVVLGRDDSRSCWADHITTRFVKFLQTRSVLRWRESRAAGNRSLLLFFFFFKGGQKNLPAVSLLILRDENKIKVFIFSHLGPILAVLLSGMR